MGPTGLAEDCRGGGGKLRFSLSGGAISTDVVFPGGAVRLEEQSLSALVSYRIAQRWTLLAGSGALLGGSVAGESLDTGYLAFVGASYRALAGGGAVPFVSIGATASLAHSRAAPSSLTSADLKLSATAAWPIADRIAPYLGAAIFGGPVWYRDQTGGDHSHYQVILGAALALPLGLDAFLQGSPLGERELSGGIGFTY